jgi:hypothetical protein
MFGHSFFEIPVYRCSLNVYLTELKKNRQNYLQYINTISGVPREEAPESYATAEYWFEQKHVTPWHYNQALGWLRLDKDHSSIKAEYYFVSANKVSKRLKHKRFFWEGKAFELHPVPRDSSSTIFESVLNAIKDLQKEQRFKNRYIDLEAFRNLGPFVNWRALLGFGAASPDPSYLKK